MKKDIAANPLHISLLCAIGIVLHSDRVTDLFQQFLGSRFRLHWVVYQPEWWTNSKQFEVLKGGMIILNSSA